MDARGSTSVLRPYQAATIARYEGAIADRYRRIIIEAPTGSGKTIIATEIINNEVSGGRRVLFLAHRHELIQQASTKLHANGLDHGIIKAGFSMRLGEPVQVASVQTLWSRAVRSSAIELPSADLVVIDEAHHARARTYRKIIDSYPEAVILGLTATPCRGDGRGLGNIFDVMIRSASVADLIKQGYLVPTKVYAPTTPDLTGVSVARGDYVEKQLAAVMDDGTLIGDIVEHWHRLAERRKTVVFATGVNHSVHLRDEFRRSGVWAEHIDGCTPADERDKILARLSRGDVEVVCNCFVLTEGWDQPDVSCLVLARPTRHMGLYRQMIGRVLRPAPGKTDALVLDHAGAVFQHGFVEDPIAWTLDTDRRAENPANTARSTGKAPMLTTCPECRAIRRSGHPCGSCGWKPTPKPAAVDVADGELGRVDRSGRAHVGIDTPSERRDFFAQLLFIVDERGYKRGWADHKFKEKFGDWPPRDWQYTPPQAPDDATRSWVRSRMIAYAKAQRAA